MPDQMSDEVEIPQAPGGETETVEFSDTVDASIFDGVSEQQEALPLGIYHFRLDQCNKRTGGDDKEPYFQTGWVCQEEPHVGRLVIVNISWVSEEVAKAAVAGDATAKETVRKRMWKAKQIMSACGYQPSGSFSFSDFAATNPEAKIQTGRKPGKAADGTGKFVLTGQMNTTAIKFHPLHRPT